MKTIILQVRAGESVMDGAIRELREELGVEVKDKDLQYIATVKSTKNPKNMEFQYVYLLKCNKKAEGLLIHDEEFKRLFEYIRNNY